MTERHPACKQNLLFSPLWTWPAWSNSGAEQKAG